MLSVSKLCARYGAIRALDEVSLEVGPGSLVALLGANGAGKTTFLRTIAGAHRAASGTVHLDGRDITRRPLYAVVRAGMALVPEGRMVAAPLTVEENLRMSGAAGRGEVPAMVDRAFTLFPRLAERRKQTAGLLSGGEQQMLAIARALITRPQVLLLDEPSMGLAPSVVDVVYESVMTLHAEGQAILLVEQNAALALPIADAAYVLHRGRVVASGPAEELHDSPEIRAAYLG